MLTKTDKTVLGLIIGLTLYALISAPKKHAIEKTKANVEMSPNEKWERAWEQKRKRRLAGYAKADQPDQFFQLYNALRTRFNEKSPGYKLGYRQAALEKAKYNS